MDEIAMCSCEAIIAQLPHSLIRKAFPYLTVKIIRQIKIKECLFFLCFLTPRLCIKACVVINPLLGITWLFGLLLPVHKAFAYIFTIFNSTQVNVQWLLSKIIQSWLYKSRLNFQPSETPLQWLNNIYWNYENKKLLTMLNKTDFFFISSILPKFLFICI